MKNKLPLSALLAFFAIITIMSSCKKETKNDVEFTKVEVMRGVNDRIRCPHCQGWLYDISPYLNILQDPDGTIHTETVVELGYGHRHEYEASELCFWQLSCTYYQRHHEHLVYYRKYDNGPDHYQDDWVHLGGGGEGGN